MRKIVSLILAAVLLMSSAIALVSCGEPKDDGAVINVYLGGPIYDFDPTDYYVDSNAERVMSLLFEPLFAVNEKGKLKTDAAAKKYEVDEEERTITIELRQTYWSDGVAVTAEDFVYAWRNILLNPNVANPAAALLYDIENAYELENGKVSVYEFGAVASERDLITITYREGADVERLLKNLASVATAPIRQDVATNITSGYWTKLVNTATTNGPFMIGNVDYEENSFTLIRNQGYHQKLGLKDPTKVVNPSEIASLMTIKNGDASLSYSDIEKKTVFFMSDATLADRQEYKKKAIVSDDLSTYTYVFNTTNELFAIKEVRKALSLAIDRKALAEAVTFAKAATGFLPDNILNGKKTFSPEAIISISADISGANAALNGVDLSGVNKNFTLAINNDEESLAIAALVKTAWESLDAGFKVEIKAVDYITSTIKDDNDSDIELKDSEIQVLANRAARGDYGFDVLAVDWQMYSTDAFVALSSFATEFSGCGTELPSGEKKYVNISGYTSETYDKLIADAYAKKDNSERNAVLVQAEKELVESYCVLPLLFNQNFAFVHKDVSKVEFNGFGDFIFTEVKLKHYRDYLK